MKNKAVKFLSLVLITFTVSSQALALCQKDQKFADWLVDFKNEARQQKISSAAIEAAAPYLTFSEAIIARDHDQKNFQQTFLKFVERAVRKDRLSQAEQVITVKHKELFEKIDKDFGVPGSVIAALWALESDFGASSGKYSTLTAVTTLAYDCRRADKFRLQAFDALRMIERGDQVPENMIGNWAGELGGLQFMSSDYYESGFDYDGDHRIDMIKSIPDTLASTANYLVRHGWQRGQPWIQEVNVADTVPWQDSGTEFEKPISEWQRLGVKAVNGQLPKKQMNASLVLPMGHAGPAFLVFPNFKVFLKWNASTVYTLTAAYFASQIAGAPPLNASRFTVDNLSPKNILELQVILNKLGLNVGEPDGKIGAATQAAVKIMQIKYSLPADSYPTNELLRKIKEN
jgi:lytic murein transglycosylase